MPDQSLNEVMTEQQYSDYVKISRRKAQRDRQTGDGPAYCVLGSRIVYRRADVDAWLATKRVCSTSEQSDRVRQAA